MTLDELFEQKGDVAKTVLEELEKVVLMLVTNDWMINTDIPTSMEWCILNCLVFLIHSIVSTYYKFVVFSCFSSFIEFLLTYILLSTIRTVEGIIYF